MDKVQPVDVIEDDHARYAIFSGLLFTEGREPIVGADEKPKCYIVTTRAQDGSDDPKRVSPNLAKDAKPVYTWPESERRAVLVSSCNTNSRDCSRLASVADEAIKKPTIRASEPANAGVLRIVGPRFTRTRKLA